MISLVTGGAWFMGGNPVDHFFQPGRDVVAYDSFTMRQKRSLERAQTSPRFKLSSIPARFAP